MFSAKKSEPIDTPSNDAGSAVEQTTTPATAATTKGRPTPKRSQSEARNKRPLVPGDRRAAARESRVRQKEARARAYEGMRRGEERFLAARDKGPHRRYIREWIDARWNIGEFFLPIALGFIVFSFFAININSLVALGVLFGLYGVVIAVIADSFVLWFKLKKRLTEKFGSTNKGDMMYAVLRAAQIRRGRIPKISSKTHGNWPS